jgi:hypothetical protein
LANDNSSRKALIIENDAASRQTIRVLLGSIGYHCVFASNVTEALVLVEQENPTIAILDPQREGFSKLILRMQGRVIIIKGASRGPGLGDLLKLYAMPQIQRDRLVQELPLSLQAIRPSPKPQRVTRLARLISDSSLEPLPTGVRSSHWTGRRLLFYECGSLSVDVLFERKKDTAMIGLVGQIQDSANPDRRMEGIPVVLQGPKGAIALAMTNKYGEFHADFDVETNVTVELQTGKNRWVTLVSPSLEWATNTTGADS